jgi:hypothetical protein
VGGPVTINQNGNLQLGRIATSGALKVTASGTLSGTTAGGTWVHSANAITLDAFGIGTASDLLQTETGNLTITNRSGNAWIFNTGPVNVTGSSVGGLHLENLGAITSGNTPVTAGGQLDLIARSPIVIGSGGVQGGSGVLLRADTPDASNSSILINGPVSAPGGAVVISAYNNITQNADITGHSASVSSTRGNIQMAATALTRTSGGDITYQAPAGDMILARIDAGSGGITLDAGGSIAPAVGVTGANISGASAHITAGGNLELTTNVSLLDVDAAGRFTVTNGTTVFTNELPDSSGADQTAKDINNAADKASTDKTPTEDTALRPHDPTRNDPNRPPGDLSKTVGGTEGSFGSEDGGKKDEKDRKDDKKSDDTKDGEKNDKPVAKKVAQCS